MIEPGRPGTIRTDALGAVVSAAWSGGQGSGPNVAFLHIVKTMKNM
jgi:hypothetical protein